MVEYVKAGEDFKLEVRSRVEDVRADWQRVTQLANFLKHADTDQDAIIKIGDVDNRTLLWRSINAWVHLNQIMTHEMLVFILLYWSSFADVTRRSHNLIDEPRAALLTLASMNEVQRLDEAKRMLQRLNNLEPMV